MASTNNRGVTVRDVAPTKFIKAYAEHLKNTGRMELPWWVDTIKTGFQKQLAPYDPDWYYIRAAAVARKVYLEGGIGVNHLRKKFCSVNHRGTAPSHHAIGSGGHIRHILQQLEQLKVVEKSKLGGRQITREGQQDLDRIARSVFLDDTEDS